MIKTNLLNKFSEIQKGHVITINTYILFKMGSL